jgi:DNA polymerase III alpha subunit (gram-positive type)
MYYCVLDTETTGLNPEVHEIIELAAIITNSSLKPLDTLSFRIQPKYLERAEKKALEINGYNPDTWNPQFFAYSAALRQLNKMIYKFGKDGPVVLTGQNIKFDIGFLVETYKRERVEFPFASNAYVDLMDVSKLWSKCYGIKLERHNLNYLSTVAGVSNERPHSALYDAEATLKVLEWFITELKKKEIVL